ncbi:MAG: M6 family metalloprotease domain-containing protein [Muribaculaceae bacterium]|nr:M6 family metalloprotease domain-containing protein [Muribaculaceae bacterium]
MKRYIFSALLGISAVMAYGVPARPGLMTVQQPDGSEVKVRLIGDERHHYYLSEDGYLLANEDGFFYYADADDEGRVIRSDFRLSGNGQGVAAYDESLRSYLSGIRQDALAEKMNVARNRVVTSSLFNNRLVDRIGRLTRSGESVVARPGLCPDSYYPSTGEQRALVILVEFADVSMTLDNPHDYFSRMLNEPGFSDWGGTGSARDYFLECSDGQFSPQFDLYGPVKLPNRMAYYGANSADGNDRRPAHMIADACAALDDEVDFSRYDMDHDGVIDNVFVFYAGEGEASGGAPETIWPHSWYVTAALPRPQIFDGVRLDRYACSCEWVVTKRHGRPDGVGTFIHEFSHVLGLPDLYATGYTDCFTPEGWSALDGGSYNNDGCTPPLYSAFERYALGWLTPFDMTDSAAVTLNSIGSNEAGIFLTKDADGEPNPNEYFLVENRQKMSWDSYIPGHGMLVWHIDYDDNVWWDNEVNNKPNHQHVDLVEADGSTFANKDRRGDAFPGKKNVTSFGDDTKPSARSWAGIPSGISLVNIAEKDGIITFDMNGGASAPMISDASGIRWEIQGSVLRLSGITPGTEVKIYDLTGNLIAEVKADESGETSVSLPHTGIYIVHTPAKTLKVIFR